MRHKISLLLFIILTLSCDKDLVELHPIGGQPCVIFEGNIFVGEVAERITCHTGLTEIKKEGSQYKEYCVGSSLPSREICDFIDNDCNSIIDNISIPPFTLGNVCYESEVGICKYSTYDCVDGQMLCTRPVWAGPPIELCDAFGIDEDCDNLVNEEDPSIFLFGEEWQYSGPDGTENRGVCQAGHNECIDGKETVFGMIVPQNELCSDDLDNDCDERIDEREETHEETEFLISLDVSSSMGLIRKSYDEIFCRWSEQEVYQDD